MTRMISLDTVPKRSRRISEISIGLAIVALALMLGEWLVAPTNDATGTAFVQLVLAVVCLAVGAVYLFGDHGEPDESSEVIDLRTQADDTEAPTTPRQVPDARATGVFAT